MDFLCNYLQGTQEIRNAGSVLLGVVPGSFPVNDEV